jgi:putative lipoic acid-binding regulatory protein
MIAKETKSFDLNQHKLDLDYPCSWKYKVVIRSEQNINNIIKEVLEDRKYGIKPSKTSSKGKFNSHTLEMIVHNEEDRKNIYKLLGEHQYIKMVV